MAMYNSKTGRENQLQSVYTFAASLADPKPVNDGFHVVIHPNNGFAIDFGIILHNWRIQKHGRSTEPNKIRFRNSKKEAEKHRIIGLETLAPI